MQKRNQKGNENFFFFPLSDFFREAGAVCPNPSTQMHANLIHSVESFAVTVSSLLALIQHKQVNILLVVKVATESLAML